MQLAQRLLLFRDDEIHWVDPADTRLTRQPANDPARRLFEVDWSPSADTCIASGARGRALQAAAFDRGVLAGEDGKPSRNRQPGRCCVEGCSVPEVPMTTGLPSAQPKPKPEAAE